MDFIVENAMNKGQEENNYEGIDVGQANIKVIGAITKNINQCLYIVIPACVR